MPPSTFPDDRSRQVHEWKERILARYLDEQRIALFDPGDGNNIFYVRDQLLVPDHAVAMMASTLDRYGTQVAGPRYHLAANDGAASAMTFAATSAANVGGRGEPYPGMATFALDPAKKVDAAELALELSGGRLDTASPNHIVIGLQIRRGFPDGDPEPAAQPLPVMPSPIPGAGRGVTVAIVDTGFPVKPPTGLGWFDYDCDHHTAAGEVDDAGKPLRDVDMLDQDHDGYLDAEAGHGVFVAGLVRRAAPRARLVFLKALNSDGIGTEYGVARAVGYATARGAHVVNLSLGFYTLHDTAPHGLRSAVDAARRGGAVLVAAAGNDALASPTYPAAFDDVVAVAAHDRVTGEPATFTNTGPWIDVTAPGVREQSTYVPGREDARLTRDGTSDRFVAHGATALWSGTSFACGHVSGYLASAIDPVKGDVQAQASDAIGCLGTNASGLRKLTPAEAF